MDAEYHLNNTYFTSPKDYDGIRVYQIGRMFAKGATIIEPHAHTFLFELTSVTSGKGRVLTNGIPSSVECGDIYISFPGDIHKIESDRSDPLKFDFLAFTVEEEMLSRELEHVMRDRFSPETRLFRDAHVSDLISDAIMESNEELPFSDTLLCTIFRQILVYTLRSLGMAARGTADISRGDILCYGIMNYIDTHIYSMRSLSTLSEVTGYSYTYISGVFRHVTSETVSEYYRRRRLEEASRLLASSSKTVSEIAESLNYSSGYALSKSFAAYFGMPPKEYRKLKKS